MGELNFKQIGTYLTSMLVHRRLTPEQYAAAMVRLFDPYKAPEQLGELLACSLTDHDFQVIQDALLEAID